MKYLINRLKTVLLTGLFLFIYHSIGTAQAIDIIDPDRAMAAQCSQCHGMEGNESEGFERLNGKPFDDIYDDLWEMVNSSKNELMNHQANGYTNEDIIALANYFAGQPKTNDGDSDEDSIDSEDSEDAKDEDEGDEKDEEDEED